MTNAKLLFACLAAAALGSAWGQSTTYKPGDFQSLNPNVQIRNPFYFEGRVDWNLLKIDQPSNAWEFAQRGIYKQDDLEDISGAIADYRQSIARNSLNNGTCQLITTVRLNLAFGQNTDPAPCMFTVRLRLGYLLRESAPEEAIVLFQEVLKIDPLRLGVNQLIAEVYSTIAHESTDDADRQADLNNALTYYQKELDLSPVTALSVQLTGDEANNAHTHWEMAETYHTMGDPSEACQLDLYLKATKWHSDTYVWRIPLAKARLANLAACPTPQP